MANRNIDTNLWNDPKITDDFTPEDKYFWLYLLTCKYGNLSGVFEITYKQIARDMGYSEEAVRNLIYRFKTIHHMIAYSEETQELFIYNWYKYNWTKSPLFEKSFLKHSSNIKSLEFKELVEEMYEDYKSNDTVLIPYRYVTNTISNTVSNSITKDKDKEDIVEVLDYLNSKLGTKYRASSQSTSKFLNARLKQYTVEDIKMVIDYKYSEWHGSDMEKYLRPETLFNETKFESYYNQAIQKHVKSEEIGKVTKI